jgi:hypothetical protein
MVMGCSRRRRSPVPLFSRPEKEVMAMLAPLVQLVHAGGALDRAALLAGLQQLAALLQDSDLAATDAMARLSRQFRPVLGQELEPLEDAVAQLQFACAAGLCRRLMETCARVDAWPDAAAAQC